jgi:hypothetical protein
VEYNKVNNLDEKTKNMYNQTSKKTFDLLNSLHNIKRNNTELMSKSKDKDMKLKTEGDILDDFNLKIDTEYIYEDKNDDLGDINLDYTSKLITPDNERPDSKIDPRYESPAISHNVNISDNNINQKFIKSSLNIDSSHHKVPSLNLKKEDIGVFHINNESLIEIEISRKNSTI